jgi:4-diphosphocytidyl-2-C-methyl-D-erythritol kinase
MISFPNAKINLGIKVLAKRPDGFHDIDTVFYPVPLCDILEITALAGVQGQTERFYGPDSELVSYQLQHNGHGMSRFVLSGLEIEGNPDSNLCVKAFRLFDSIKKLKNEYLIHLHKVIPTGAGLGGGSSDAAFVLTSINRLENDPFSKAEIAEMALLLGSDCPFFLFNQPCLASGRGEVMRPVDVSLNGYYLVIVKAPYHVSTADAFRNVKPGGESVNYKEAFSFPVSEWKNYLTNDFESYVFKQFPMVAEIKQQLHNSGAVFCSMTGSGSAVYGIFEKQPVNLNVNSDYFYFQTKLL